MLGRYARPQWCTLCAQAKLQALESTRTEQAAQIATLREELQGSLAELDQVVLLQPCCCARPRVSRLVNKRIL